MDVKPVELESGKTYAIQLNTNYSADTINLINNLTRQADQIKIKLLILPKQSSLVMTSINDEVFE